VVVEEESGILVGKDDKDDFVDAVLNLLGNDKLCNEMVEFDSHYIERQILFCGRK